MQGFYTCWYLADSEIGKDDQPENFQNCDPSQLFKLYVNPFQLRLPLGSKFIKNPLYEPYMNYNW